MTERVTVVVVTWNGAHLLAPCLDALAAQTLPAEEVRTVVVDNASTDGTAELLACYPHVQVVTSERNLGFAGGATLGLQGTVTPFAAVLNNDAAPDRDWLEQLLDGFEDGVAAVTSKVLLAPRYVRVRVDAAVAEIGAVTVDGADVSSTVILHPESSGVELAVPAADGAAVTVQVSTRSGPPLLRATLGAEVPRVDVLNSTGGQLTPTGHGADRGYLEIDQGQYDEQRDVFAVCGAAAAFRTEVAGLAGWFDPWLFAYYEDLDLSWRLRRAGWQVRYAPLARVRHRHAATSRVGSDLFLFHNRRNRLATLARNASLPELTRVLAASLRPRQPESRTLGTVPAAADWPAATRSKLTALLSFLAHLPRLLASRRRAAPRPAQVAPARGAPRP